MALKGAEIDIVIIFIILTDFLTLNKLCDLNEKPVRNSHF